MKSEKLANTKDGNEYSLINLDNYKETLTSSIQDILDNLVRVIVDYVIFITEKLNIKYGQYYQFIFERGLYSLLHIFSIILYHTNNLDLTIYHCQKAYYFYIEFIEQIADDNVTFLKLSSKDAVMFVYKRTIFELNNDFRKKTKNVSNDENNMYLNLNIYIHFYKKIFHNMIKTTNFDYENKKDLMNKLCFKIEEMSVIINKSKFKNLQIECINNFYDMLIDCNMIFEDSFTFLLEFIKQIAQKKSILSQKTIQNKISNCIKTNYIQENGYQNLINYIFTQEA